MTVKTMKIGSAEYAKVADRLKQFREDCPYAGIETTPHFENGQLVYFKANIIKDRREEHSATGTGTAFMYEEKGKKAFEKVESIAIGRALANLGYMASGEIASSEEMERFLEQTELKWRDEVDQIDTIEDLKQYYQANKGKGKEFDKYVTARKKTLLDKDKDNADS